jgi:hypothetical protein
MANRVDVIIQTRMQSKVRAIIQILGVFLCRGIQAEEVVSNILNVVVLARSTP